MTSSTRASSPPSWRRSRRPAPGAPDGRTGGLRISPPGSRGMSKPDRVSAADFLPARRSLAALRKAAAACRGCDLYRDATQTVFGEGPSDASIVLIGEEPGDREDIEGHPFVGPAGRLLNAAMDEAALDPKAVYITNAVKHFKWEPRGKRRIHKKPQDREIDACRPWLEAEVEAIRPQIVVCMGVSAMRAAFGRSARLRDFRGRFCETSLSRETFVTVHPSSILRLRKVPGGGDYEAAFREFIADLARVRERVRA